MKMAEIQTKALKEKYLNLKKINLQLELRIVDLHAENEMKKMSSPHRKTSSPFESQSSEEEVPPGKRSLSLNFFLKTPWI